MSSTTQRHAPHDLFSWRGIIRIKSMWNLKCHLEFEFLVCKTACPRCSFGMPHLPHMWGQMRVREQVPRPRTHTYTHIVLVFPRNISEYEMQNQLMTTRLRNHSMNGKEWMKSRSQIVCIARDDICLLRKTAHQAVRLNSINKSPNNKNVYINTNRFLPFLRSLIRNHGSSRCRVKLSWVPTANWSLARHVFSSAWYALFCFQ